MMTSEGKSEQRDKAKKQQWQQQKHESFAVHAVTVKQNDFLWKVNYSCCVCHV